MLVQNFVQKNWVFPTPFRVEFFNCTQIFGTKGMRQSWKILNLCHNTETPICPSIQHSTRSSYIHVTFSDCNGMTS